MAGSAVLAIDSNVGEMSAAAAWRNRHYLLRLQLDRNIGRKLMRKPSRIVRERVAPGRMGDAFSVWRRARALRMAADRDAKTA
jgi:hypothetical protein